MTVGMNPSDSCWRFTPNMSPSYMMEIDEGSRLGLEVLRRAARDILRSALPPRRLDGQLSMSAGKCAQLAAAGYEHYEISNWALPGFESRHNLKYWRREPYFGYGAGAHSFQRDTTLG